MSMATASTSTADDWRSLSLQDGQRCLIEASAGTGKTWTIGVLYLRLLLERRLTARQILVATFTDAAAQELRERIRLRLHWAEQRAERFALLTTAAEDEESRYLMQRWQDQRQRCDEDRLHLRLALSELDLAPIVTLHGLCLRILQDHAFAAGDGLMQGELIAAQDLRDELLDDLKRRLAQSQAAIDAGDQRWLQDFNALAAALRQLEDPDIRIDAPELVALDAFFSTQQAAQLRDLAADDRLYVRSNSALRSALRRLADYVERADPSVEFKPERLLAERTLDKQIKPAFIDAMRNDPRLDFAARAAIALASHDAATRAAALRRYRDLLHDWRARRLRERGLFTYDALIERVHAALSDPSRAATLADALFGAWPVALIDEFQDTDARQYAILDRIYRDAEAGMRGCLVMIGDPKQAIYAFRGGDIHTYRRAVSAVDQRLNLKVNRRASRAYVRGLNAFYALVTPGLARSDEPRPIDYVAVAASERRDGQPYTIDGEAVPRPLVVHYREEIPAAARLREHEALLACAREISAMLASGRHRIGDAPLQPADIAVLLPNHRQIMLLHRLLGEHGVPCAGVGRQPVLDSIWARELQVILYALAHLDDGAAARAALSTRLLGWKPLALRALNADATRWQQVLQQLQQLAEVWQQLGVLALVQRLIEQAAVRLSADADYERSITDLRHLGELLQEASESLHGPAQLLAWLSRQRSDPDYGGEDSDDRQLRIESDAARVRLLTLHASKGLEFRIVFLPLMWAHQARPLRGRAAFPVITNPVSGQRVADLGTPQQALRAEQAAKEEQDERFRVLYVALTRAEYACHVFALSPKRATDARTTRVQLDPERSALDALIERVLEAQQRTPHILEQQQGWAWCSGWPQAGARYSAATPERAVPRVPSLPALRPLRAVHSFSNLLRCAPLSVEETAAIDEAMSEPVAIDEEAVITIEASGPHTELLALDGLRGTELGNALHAVFEHRQPDLAITEQLSLVTTAFDDQAVPYRTHGGDAVLALWAQRIDAVLSADLGQGLCLADLSADAQRAEMEFHFAVDQVSIAVLRGICARHGQPNLIPDAMSTSQLNGMLTGKIDLVLQHADRFHVLDYKGNALGTRVEDYLGATLDRAMDAHHYRFQALIYTLAVDRMLRARLPGYDRARDLGDVIYLFVRAAGLAAQAGVWRQRFDDVLIDALQAAFGASGSVS